MRLAYCMALATLFVGEGCGPSSAEAVPSTSRHAVQGTVSGLTGSGLVLENNGGDDLAVSSNGVFAFATSIAEGGSYAVSVKVQPAAPSQTCTVSGGSGAVGGGDVTSVVVACVTDPPPSHAVGGAVTGLTGAGLVLQNNGGDDLAVSSNGAFAFATLVAEGGSYAVSIKAQPTAPSQACTVSGGSGAMGGGDVMSVVVACVSDPPPSHAVGGSVTGLMGTGLVLQNNGGDDLAVSSDGAFTFATPVPEGGSYAVSVKNQPASPAEVCQVVDGTGSVGGIDVTSVDVVCAAIPTIVEFAIPTSSTSPLGIVAGPDGNLWFAELVGNRIGRITPGGVVTEFTIPTLGSFPRFITAGPDGNLWFTESRSMASQIGCISTSGIITEFPVMTSGSMPWGITSGPDGNVWFTESYASRIGRITPSGVITEFATPTGSSMPMGIAAGSDGNLWFAESGANKIGRITPSGTIIEFAVPSVGGNPQGVAAGPDGSVWFTETAGNKIGRITPSGVVTEFVIPTSDSSPYDIVAGPDGNLWFTEDNVAGQIGRITPSGVIHEFAIPAGYTYPAGIAAGPDGNLWFTNLDGIGRLAP